MAYKISDRVRETTTTTGTGTITLAGAVTNYQTFLAGIGTGNTTTYCLLGGGGGWEVGTGTVGGGGTTLSRDSVEASSVGGGSKISLSGTSTVFSSASAYAVARLNRPNMGYIREYGGTGVGTETAVITAAEASAYEFIDLQGLTIVTTTFYTVLTKKYCYGRLFAKGAGGNVIEMPTFTPAADETLLSNHTKTFKIDWEGAKILWLGTSIPAQGKDDNGYPHQVAKAFNATIVNMAFAASYMYFDDSIDPYQVTPIRPLSMTEDDRAAMEALYPGSVYDDSFTPIGPPSFMTCTYRIDEQFDSVPFDIVVLDHAHNDVTREEGTLTPTPIDIIDITKSTTTTVTLGSSGLVAVGDGVALQVEGIAKLNHFAGRVISVSTDTFVLNVDSSAFDGTFVSGEVIIYDRNTLTGSSQFLIHFIYSSAIRRGFAPPTIIMAGAPSKYTTDNYSPPIWSVAKTLKTVAEKWSLSFFDIGFHYGISERDHIYYFPDGTHPNTAETRQALANHWVQWIRGGAPLPMGDYNVIMRGGNFPHLEGHAAEYMTLFGGYGTPPFVLGTPSSELEEDFQTGKDGWTDVGTAPTVGAAPWGGGDSAIYCISDVGAIDSHLSRAISLSESWTVEFDIEMPNVILYTGIGVRATNILEFANTGIYYFCQILHDAYRSYPRFGYFSLPAGGEANLHHLSTRQSVVINPNTKHHISIQGIRSTSTYSGVILLKMDDEFIAAPTATLDPDQTDSTLIRFGITDSTVDDTVEIYLSNLVVNNVPVGDYTQRFTGTFEANDGSTISVVNGVITVVTPPAALTIGGAPLTVGGSPLTGL